MKVKKYPESLPDLDIYRRDHEHGVSLIINTPERWCDWRTGGDYVEILLDGDEPGINWRRYFIHMDFGLRNFHTAYSTQEKDQISVIFLSMAGHSALF